MVDITEAYCDYFGFGVEEPLGLVVPEVTRPEILLNRARDEIFAFVAILVYGTGARSEDGIETTGFKCLPRLVMYLPFHHSFVTGP